MYKSQKLSWWESFALNVLKVGEIPRHIGFIMDGNRRYAEQRNMLINIGHKHGAEKMAQTLGWCKQIGVNEVTVYAFSIENFKRSEKEVTDLMSLGHTVISTILNEKDDLQKHGVCVRFFGSLHLCPREMQTLMARLVLETRHNTKAYFNVCIAYSSRQEISEAMKKIVDGVASQCIKVEDIDENLLEKCLYTGRCPHPDLIVRTSGEIRLSDFLLWQSSFAVLVFVEELWPAFSFWSFCYVIFYYQRHHQKVSKVEADYTSYMNRSNMRELKDDFYSSHEMKLEEFRLRGERRISEFLANLETKELETMTHIVKIGEVVE